MQWRVMMAVRGSLGILLGATVLLWPAVGLGELVTLFGIYASIDGIAAAAWALRVSRRPFEGWPMLLEGVFSVGVGVSALAGPFQSAPFAHMVALWALVTGILEILAAAGWPRATAARWFLAAGGAWSSFIAVLVLTLPHALTGHLVMAVGVYALVFGILVFVGAFTLRPMPPLLVGTVDHRWTAR